jgi:hypothetical protein
MFKVGVRKGLLESRTLRISRSAKVDMLRCVDKVFYFRAWGDISSLSSPVFIKGVEGVRLKVKKKQN